MQMQQDKGLWMLCLEELWLIKARLFTSCLCIRLHQHLQGQTKVLIQFLHLQTGNAPITKARRAKAKENNLQKELEWRHKALLVAWDVIKRAVICALTGTLKDVTKLQQVVRVTTADTVVSS